MRTLQIHFAECSSTSDVKQLYAITGSSCQHKLSCEFGEIMKRIWNDKGVQESFTRSWEYQLTDSAGYFLDGLSLMSETRYGPTQQDVLTTQMHTTGITTTKFFYRDLNFKFFCVDGQRQERKKWLHCFEGVNAVIFCVALSEYDLVLREDINANRMMDSMILFISICNNRMYVITKMFLFLNKKDLFEGKVKIRQLTVCF